MAADPAASAFRPVDGLRYLFIDFNAFFAAVEQHDRPELFGRPVIVAPHASEHTSAIAVSYEARPYGIRRGTGVLEARALCPDLTVLPARHDRYVAVHRLAMAEIQRHLPLDRIFSIDEAAFRLSRGEAEPEAARAIARAVKRGLADNVGPALRASIGLAPTRLLAKIAAELEKPDGLTVIAPGDLPDRLRDAPLTDLPGVGPGVAARLAAAGVHDFLSLWRLQPKQARAIWNSVQGERFWYALHGYEVAEPETKKSMIGHSRVLTPAHERPEAARIVARALLLKAASRLRHYGMHARALALGVRRRPAGEWMAALDFPYSQNSFCFLKALDRLWAEFLDAHGRVRGLRCGTVTVSLYGLAAAGDPALAQADLFETGCESDARQARLWRAIDRINADSDRKFQRLGRPGAGLARARVTLARQQGMELDYLGAKIAFSRVPDDAEFLY